MENLFLIAIAVCSFVLLIYVLKKNKTKYFLLSAISGLAALFTADLIGGFFEFNLPINFFSAAICVIAGLPGVIMLNLLHALFR